MGRMFQDMRTTAYTSVNDNRVYINPLMIVSGATTVNSGLLVHEALHTFGLIDPVIQTALFGLPGVNPTTANFRGYPICRVLPLYLFF